MKRPHLTPQEINAYMHNTTTDADRESLDRHLALCQLCQTRLQAEQEFKGSLTEAIQRQVLTFEPKGSLDFEGISAEMHRHRKSYPDFQYGVSGISALAGILLVILSIFQVGSQAGGEVLPVFACACFTLPLYTVSSARQISTRQLWIILVSVLLCVGIAMLGLYEIYLVQQLTYRVLYFFSADHSISAAFSGISLILAACGWVIAVIGNLDFQIKHRQDKNAWRMLRWTLLVESFILLLPLVI